jgi:hypothetical protein
VIVYPWAAAFWVLVFVKPLAAVCLWLTTLLYFVVVLRVTR